MSKQKPARIVPKLRFPEFEEDEEWKFREIREVGDIVTGKTPNTKDDSLWNGNILFITPTDIDEQAKYQISTQRKVVETKETKLLPPGSILYTCIASIGKIAITKSKSISNQQINSIITNSKNNNEFIYYCLLHLTPWIKSIPAASTLPIINKKDFSKIKIKITPNKKEQQKIAACLTALDDLISAATERLDALKQHKQGLMQQLFPTEGGTVPRLRFAEFRDAGEWEIKPLITFCKIQTGKKDANEGTEGGKYPFFTCSEKHIYSNSYSFDTEAILVAGNANVGQTKYYKGKFEAYQRTYVLYNFQKIEVRYLYIILSAKLRDSLVRKVQQSAMSYIKLSMLKKHFIALPTNIVEQQKIAACLTALDDLITAQTQKIAKLKTHKRGLMQQLFPAVDEMHR